MTVQPHEVDSTENRAVRMLLVLAGFSNADRMPIELRNRDFDHLLIMTGSTPEEIDAAALHGQLMGWINKRQGDSDAYQLSMTVAGKAFVENLLADDRYNS